MLHGPLDAIDLGEFLVDVEHPPDRNDGHSLITVFRYHQNGIGLTRAEFNYVGLTLVINQTHERLFQGFPNQRMINARMQIHNRIRGDRSFVRDTIYVLRNQITAEFLAASVEKIVQSNDNLDLSDLEFEFYFNRNSYIMGAGKDLTRIPKGVYLGTELSYEDPQGPLSCLAVALAFSIVTEDKQNKCFKRHEKKVLKKARALMIQMNWGTTTNQHALTDFVKRHPHYRVMSHTCGWTSTQAFVGEDWHETYDDVRKRKSRLPNTFYIGYIPGIKSIGHFCALRTPDIPNHLTLCHGCLCLRCRGKPCMCSSLNPVEQPKQKPPKQCKICGMYGCQDWKCNTKCSECQTSHDPNVRCILTPPKIFTVFQKPDALVGDDDVLLPKLWAYDIETSMEGDPTSHDTLFDFDDAGQFLVHPGGAFKTRTIQRQIHTFCVLICRNVFDPTQKHIFWSLDDFFDFCNVDNDGKHVFFAHNAAGYDNRVLFNHLMDVYLVHDTDGKRRKTCTPIFVGSKILQFTFGT